MIGILHKLSKDNTLREIIKFGTDGWRGRIADDFTFENVKIVAQAIADYFKNSSKFRVQSSTTRNQNLSLNTEHSTSGIIVGYDTRFLSQKYAFIVAKVLIANGLDVLLSKEAVPSPVISYTVVQEKAQGAVMITASHNPPEYNGIKIKTFYGGPADKGITKKIEKYLYKNQLPSISDTELKTTDFKPAYIKNLKSYINMPLLRKAKLKIVIDSMFGAGGGYLERILEGFSCKMFAIHKEPDPLFGGIHPEPIEINLAELKNEVINTTADIGLATDGDADRIGVVDDKGRYLTPHQVFPLLLLYLIEEKNWRGKVIQALSLGYLGKRIAKYYNLDFEEVSVGFKNVSELIYQSLLSGGDEVLMGGEESGGYGYKGYIPERDGILSGLLLLEMLSKKKQRLSQILTEMQKRFGKSYYERIDIHLSDKKFPGIDKNVFVQNVVKKIPKQLIGIPVKELKTFDGVKIFLQDDSWLLIRPSGTEPLLRIYAEAGSMRKVKELINVGKKLGTC